MRRAGRGLPESLSSPRIHMLEPGPIAMALGGGASGQLPGHKDGARLAGFMSL